MTMLKVTVVSSTSTPDTLSLRAWSEGKGRLSATALKEGLADAGFVAGQHAYIVTAEGLAEAVKEGEKRGYEAAVRDMTLANLEEK